MTKDEALEVMQRGDDNGIDVSLTRGYGAFIGSTMYTLDYNQAVDHIRSIVDERLA